MVRAWVRVLAVEMEKCLKIESMGVLKRLGVRREGQLVGG